MHPDANITSFYAGRRVLVTGGLGTIGSRLGLFLADLGARVTLLDGGYPDGGYNPQNIAAFRDRVEVLDWDLRETSALPAAVEGRAAIFNLAGIGCHSDSMRDPLTDLEMNARAHLVLLEACRAHAPAARLVYTGTRQVYGRPLRLPVVEDEPVKLMDINAIHKHAAEQYHLLYHRVHGLPACVLRLTNVIGPGMRIRDARQVFYGQWFRDLLEGRSFEVWGGEQVRDLVYVDDVCDALLRAGARPEAAGRVLNVGSGEPVRLLDFAELLVEVCGRGAYTVRPFPEDRRRIDIGDFCADITRIRSLLGWAPRTPLREAVRRTWAYCLQQARYYL